MWIIQHESKGYVYYNKIIHFNYSDVIIYKQNKKEATIFNNKEQLLNVTRLLMGEYIKVINLNKNVDN